MPPHAAPALTRRAADADADADADAAAPATAAAAAADPVPRRVCQHTVVVHLLATIYVYLSMIHATAATSHEQKVDDHSDVVDLALATPQVGNLWTLSGSETSGTLVASFLNASTGAQTPAGELSLTTVLPHPAGCVDGEWSLVKGTRGQSSTMFSMNATLFFLAKEKCAGDTNRVVLLGLMEPSPWETPAPPLRLRLPFGLPYAAWNRSSHEDIARWGTERWNIVWDQVCNIVVLAPSAENDSVLTYETLMVSEFDSQARPQAPYSSEPVEPSSDGWTAHKVAGLAAIQYSGQELGWPDEGNCGNCPVFTLEAHSWCAP